VSIAFLNFPMVNIHNIYIYIYIYICTSFPCAHLSPFVLFPSSCLFTEAGHGVEGALLPVAAFTL